MDQLHISCPLKPVVRQGMGDDVRGCRFLDNGWRMTEISIFSTFFLKIYFFNYMSSYN